MKKRKQEHSSYREWKYRLIPANSVEFEIASYNYGAAGGPLLFYTNENERGETDRYFTLLVAASLLVFAPLVFLAHLLFLAGSEVVFDVESLADLLGGLALDHVGDSLACHIEKAFDVQVVSSLTKQRLIFFTHTKLFVRLTKMSSKRVPWSTLRKSASQLLMSSVRFSLFSSSSGGGGSSLWKVAHWITFFRMGELTLGRGTTSSSSSSMPVKQSICY